jgi:AhpD family alkylhydroperoxidase
MPRLTGVSKDSLEGDLRAALDKQVKRYGAALYNHTVLARRPGIFRGFRAMWDGLEDQALLPARLVDLINLKVAALIGCGLCIEINSAVSKADGVSDDELAALPAYAESAYFTERERAALAYADTITIDSTVPDELYQRVRRSFSDDEIVELTATVVWEIAAAKFNRALEIESQGICLLSARTLP